MLCLLIDKDRHHPVSFWLSWCTVVQTYRRVIENINVVMATYEDELLGEVLVYPEKGTVAFSAGLHGWAFTLSNFAKMYADKFKVDRKKMMERLWGESYFDPTTKKWTSKPTGAATCVRGFVQFIYNPIKQVRVLARPCVHGAVRSFRCLEWNLAAGRYAACLPASVALQFSMAPLVALLLLSLRRGEGVMVVVHRRF